MAPTDDQKPTRKALGKGLGALIPKQAESAEKREFIRLPIARIDTARPQPRTYFDGERIEELAESIKESGLIQPLVVRERQGRYELIAGERRLRACKRAGLSEVPVVIKDVTDFEAYTLALIENIQREDLNPVEEALAYQKLLDDSGLSQADLAIRVGKSRSALANSVRLLTLSEFVLDLLASGELSAGHARAIITLEAEAAERLAAQVVAEGWSVRETEEYVRNLKEPPGKKAEPKRNRYRDDALVRDLTERLQHSLGTRVKVKDRQGKGKIEIFYDDVEILQSVLDRIIVDDKESQG
ncbi:ParB/RepB/Spo0J family partition protein [Bradymonadaceae bacterium TMQ3]|uniref:ParB/RepB/Spo0J family partition protein n=1 Tax=Lujinxingia sediminis TaxID=2480984 RepID=A0ABY0CXI0_9DELT|nr:ParB/RepB/Spo0J family partition protein [Lujinxingia sediminis]RDV39566.1 ParB/RepB/Spo0J family partition protein [Bradymonadaceae bacterium TMQ3]RVU48388.1 ParB/RepB/Spo0J family partition protein [Lujinxingia sediminis]TXC77690.1 ParB/RepB/Spo0J family partition protein [Bradymonadales bacterium TMQ1]